jgi:hypothetical protein
MSTSGIPTKQRNPVLAEKSLPEKIVHPLPDCKTAIEKSDLIV